MKFKIGDRVKSEYGAGTIINISLGLPPILVVHDNEHSDLHDGNSPYGYEWAENKCWYFYEKEIKLIEETKEHTMGSETSRVNYILTPNAVTVVFDGKSETISQGDHRYSQVLDAIKRDDLEAIPSLVDVQKSFEGLEGVELVDGRIKLNGQDIPTVLSNRVLAFKEQGLPFKPLIKFAEKLRENPSFNSRQQLYNFLEHNGHPITKDGNFIAYKKVRTDFKDCHTGTMDNSVGRVVEMPREEVDDNPNNTCSSGLHVAAYQYAKNFSSGHLVLVEVDPRDVVSVPNDYNGEKMRVCKYEVKEICESKLEQEFYGGDESFELEYEVGDKVMVSNIDGDIISAEIIYVDEHDLNTPYEVEDEDGDIYWVDFNLDFA